LKNQEHSKGRKLNRSEIGALQVKMKPFRNKDKKDDHHYNTWKGTSGGHNS